MSARVCLLPGDGIGPEVVEAARRVLAATGAPLAFEEHELGRGTFERTGDALPEATLAAARAADASLLGAVSSPSEPLPGYRSPVVRLRRELDLFACVRRVLGEAHGLPVDLVIVREGTEGLYSGVERTEGAGELEVAVTERRVSRRASTRLAAFALALARREGRRRITLVHKANVLRATCGLFRRAALAVLDGAPDVEHDELLVDTAAHELARAPERFDVLLTTNLFGDVLSDLAAVHGGGLGLAASASLGTDAAIFEPVHGSAPDLAGTGSANPLAAIRAGALLLEHLGFRDEAARVEAAVTCVRSRGPHTPDLGGTASGARVTAAVLEALERTAPYELAPRPNPTEGVLR